MKYEVDIIDIDNKKKYTAMSADDNYNNRIAGKVLRDVKDLVNKIHQLSKSLEEDVKDLCEDTECMAMAEKECKRKKNPRVDNAVREPASRVSKHTNEAMQQMNKIRQKTERIHAMLKSAQELQALCK